MELTIRKAREEDASKLAGLLREIGWSQQIRQEQPAQTAEQVGRHLALCLADDSHSIYVAEQVGAEILGYIAVHWLPYLILKAPEGFVSELFVREAARGQGTGSRLLEAVTQEERRRGCARLQLINMRGRESYQRSFYQKAGWQERPDAADFILPIDAASER